MEHEKHIVPYKTYLIILLALLTMTAISVAVTRIDLGTLTVTVALLLATMKTGLVLLFFMHLKFDQRIYAIMVGGVFLLVVLVMIVTFLDYAFHPR